MKKLSFAVPFILLILTQACLCPCPEENQSQKNDKVLLFGHRGSGGGVVNGLIENTLPSVSEVLKYADGTEVDVQMSQSKTIWLYHNDQFTDLCSESQELLTKGGYNCILNTPDEVIEQLRICKNGVEDRIYKLEELFKKLSSYEDKMASLDIKGYFNSQCVEHNNVSQEYLENFAIELFRLVQEFNLNGRIIAETPYTHLFGKIKELDPNFICHYMSFNNLPRSIDKAIAANSDGITINIRDSDFNLDNINKAKKHNLTIQMWTIHSKDDAEVALKYAPYALQVGNINLLKELLGISPQERKSQLFH